MVTFGFRPAGMINIVGILIFSLALTNERMIDLSPVVCSRFGMISIMLWGGAYLAVAKSYKAVPYLVGVFAVEKAIYVVTWVVWINHHGAELPALFGESPLTAVFYAIYGPNDLAFGVFFAIVALRACSGKKASGSNSRLGS